MQGERLYSPKTCSQLPMHTLPKQNSEYTRAQLSGNKSVMRNRNKNANHYVQSTFPWQNLSELSLTWRWGNEKNIFVEHLYARHLLRHKASAKEKHVFLPAQRRMFLSAQVSFKCKRKRENKEQNSKASFAFGQKLRTLHFKGIKWKQSTASGKWRIFLRGVHAEGSELYSLAPSSPQAKGIKSEGFRVKVFHGEMNSKHAY